MSIPKGQGGAQLVEGCIVKIVGLKGKKVEHLNNLDGEMIKYDEEQGRVHVRLTKDGSVKGMKPENLVKMQKSLELSSKSSKDEIKAVFKEADLNGDGVLDKEELKRLFLVLGMKVGSVNIFVESVDSDGDGTISYEEFLDWVMEPSCKFTAEGYVKKVSEKVVSTLPRDREEVDVEAKEARGEITMRMIKNLGVIIPKDWPDSGLVTAQNLQNRFPRFPLRDIVVLMIRLDYVGGMCIPHIRKTGTVEVELCPETNFKDSDGKPMFPCKYKGSITSPEPLHVYSDQVEDFSLIFMRDGKYPPAGTIPKNQAFTIFEVRQGQSYGFCFGRVDWKGNRNHWINLGIITSEDDLHFTEASRIW
eukprot:TRINITY_DN2650_c0_g1_i1.p1 TRINITY_DN2650_c0_g1~~TRINITY_DN2650_c0_g1_i1.p1  ORF type:complete len:361 (-),score=97.96 TRINITY_DN2650_c0_g1_i1:217-1299(-)